MKFSVEPPDELRVRDRVYGELIWWKYRVVSWWCRRVGHRPFPVTYGVVLCERCRGSVDE